MDALISVATAVTAFILLTAVGMDLTGDDFALLRRRFALVMTGLVVPVVLLPPLAIALTHTFAPPADVAAGVLLVAACPIGGISVAYSALARASTALSVTLTGLSCLIAGLTIPLVGKAIELALGRPLHLDAPMSNLIGQLVLVLALPVALGMWVRRRWPAHAVRTAPTLQSLAFAGVSLVFTVVIAGDVDAFARELRTTIPLAASFVAGSVAVGWATASLVSRDSRDRFTIAAEFGTRNIGVAAAVAVTLLDRLEFARFIAAYALIEVPLLLALVGWFRWRSAPSGGPALVSGHD